MITDFRFLRDAAFASGISLDGWGLRSETWLQSRIEVTRRNICVPEAPAGAWDRWLTLHELGHVLQVNSGRLIVNYAYYGFDVVFDGKRVRMFGECGRDHASLPHERDASRFAFEHVMCPRPWELDLERNTHDTFEAHRAIYEESLR